MSGNRQGSVLRWLIGFGRHLGGAALALLGVVAIVFLTTHVIADPTRLILGDRATAEQIAQLRHQLGYDRNIFVQFGAYVSDLARGDLGVSQYTQQPVAGEIARRFPVTLELSLAALILGLLWTIPLGVIAALRPGGVPDRISQIIVEVCVAIPSFWLGIIFILLFYAVWGVAPSPVGVLDIGAIPPTRITGGTLVDSLLTGRFDTARSAAGHLALPAITLALTTCPPILQLTRATMIASLESDLVRSARSFGLSERTVRWYAFKTVLPPLVTLVAMTFGFLLGGAVLIETVFSWPGIGLYSIQSMQQFDYEPVLGVVIVSAAVYILVYLLADLVARRIDPRIGRTR